MLETEGEVPSVCRFATRNALRFLRTTLVVEASGLVCAFSGGMAGQPSTPQVDKQPVAYPAHLVSCH